MHSNMTSRDYTLLQLYTEYGFKDRMMDITIGDLPPKSPEFCNMLPTLRPSPLIFLSSARINTDENSDAFHVVPSTKSADLDEGEHSDTYGNFLRQLEREDSRFQNGNIALSPTDFTVPEILMEQEENSDLLQNEDLQIYLPSEISPTPVDRLYSTLPGEESPTKTFAFPSLDENTRLENFDLQRGVTARDSESQCVTIMKEEGIRMTGALPACFTSVALTQQEPQESKPDRYVRIESKKRGNKQLKITSRKAKEKPTHNDIERQRRNDMKARFDSLKAAIPEIENIERTPKILVLSKAKEFIGKLHKKEKQLDIEKEKERKRNRILLEKLVKLTNL